MCLNMWAFQTKRVSHSLGLGEAPDQLKHTFPRNETLAPHHNVISFSLLPFKNTSSHPPILTS